MDLRTYHEYMLTCLPHIPLSVYTFINGFCSLISRFFDPSSLLSAPSLYFSVLVSNIQMHLPL